MSTHRALLLLLLLWQLTACGDVSSDEGLNAALASGSAVGRVASLVMLDLLGEDLPGVTPADSCATPLCDLELEVEFGPDTPLPLGGEAEGTAWVFAYDRDEDGALLEVDLSDVTLGGRPLLTRSASLVGVSWDEYDGSLSITYVGGDIDVDDDSGAVAQAFWLVEVDTADTPGEPRDDVFEITTMEQEAEASQDDGQSEQMVVTGALAVPGCRHNPVDGTAVSQDAGGSILVSQRIVTFHEACDGQAEINGIFGRVALDYTR